MLERDRHGRFAGDIHANRLYLASAKTAKTTSLQRLRGLRHVEHVSIAEAEQHARVLLGDVLFGFLVLLAANADDGSKDANALDSSVHARCVQGSSTSKIRQRE